jgi:hypothetical protein
MLLVMRVVNRGKPWHERRSARPASRAAGRDG